MSKSALTLAIIACTMLMMQPLQAQVPPPPPAATIDANLPNVDRGHGVIGRDDGLSILIGTNCCFFFGDTVLTQANVYGSSWVVNTMYHTTNNNGDLGVTNGYNWLSNGQSPLQFIPYTQDETNWVATNANKYVYAIWPDSQFYSPRDSNEYITINKEIEVPGGNLVDIGEGLAICPTNPITGQATRVLSRPGNAQPYLLWDTNSFGDWGDMCCTMSNYVYTYLVDGDSYGYLYVARASLLSNPPAFLSPTNWQYWNGSAWSGTMPTSSSASIMNGVGDGTIDWNAFLTNGSGGRGCYLYTYMSWVDNQIETRASSDLVHWSAPTLQYTAPTNWLPGQFPYFARAHKCLEKNNGQTIYITWSLPDTNLAYPENMPMIRAQFPPVHPIFSGLTASHSIGYGAPATVLSGTISATGACPATGETVTVTINGNAQATQISDTNGDFSINYNSSSLPASGTPYPVTYSYPGDGALYGVTNAATTLVVTQAATAIMPGSSENPSFYGESINFNATLPATATGTVSFLTNSAFFCAATLQNGLATSLSTTLLPIGTNAVSVEYAGDNNYLGSTNTLPNGQIVDPQPVPSISLLSPGVVNIMFVANPYEPYQVQTATNILGPWQVVSMNAAASNGSWLFTDPNATNPRQFYEILPAP